MKKNLTELVFIIDKSGSMSGLEGDTIGGFNSMLKKQRGEDGEAYLSTVLFDTKEQVLYDRVPIDKVPEMTAKDYVPGGCTALLDAMGGAIKHIHTIHKYAREEDRPEKTMFIIITDGCENSSRRYNLKKVRDMIEKRKAKDNWEFLFLGANIDAVKEAASFGINADRAVEYCSDSDGTTLNYRVLTEAVSSYRSKATLDSGWKAPIEADMKRRRRK